MIKKALLALVVTLLCVCFFAACNGSEEKGGAGVAVTFFPQNGKDGTKITVSGVLHSDDCPAYVKEGYSFFGWFFDEACSRPVSFPLKLENNLSLFAGWTKQENEGAHTVTFVSNGGSAVSEFTGTVLYEAPVTVMDGYTFKGWCTDETLSSAVRFPYTIEKDVILYADFELTGFTFYVDEQANKLVYKWAYDPSVDYVIETPTWGNKNKQYTRMGNVAVYEVSPCPESDFTLYIKNKGTTLFGGNFHLLSTFDINDLTLELKNDNVYFHLPDAGAQSYQIEIATPSTDSKSIYAASGDGFYLPADLFLQEKRITVRNAKRTDDKIYFAKASEKIYVERLAAPAVDRYRDGDHNLSWTTVEGTGSYTLTYYEGNEVLDVQAAVTPQKVNERGYAFLSLDPQTLFPAGDYKTFSVSVKALGAQSGNHYLLDSNESKAQEISFVGAVEITLVEDVIRWTRLDRVNTYDVFLRHNGVETDMPAKTFTSYKLDSGGRYEISVRPNPQDLNHFSVATSATYELLTSPNVVLNKNASNLVVSWDVIGDASRYTVRLLQEDAASGAIVEKESHTLNGNQVAIFSFDINDIPTGKSEIAVVAIGDGVRFRNSPATVVAVRRFETPRVTYEKQDTSIKVRIEEAESEAKYRINHTEIAGYEGSEEEGTNAKEIVLDQTNLAYEDVSFSLRVQAVPINDNVFVVRSAYTGYDVPLYYVDSTATESTFSLLAMPTDFALKDTETFSWRSGGTAQLEVKLDDLQSRGLTLGVGAERVSIRDVLAAYDKDVLTATSHVFYLRRTLPGENVLSSAYVSIFVRKLPAVTGFYLQDGNLVWGEPQALGVSGYSVLRGLNAQEMNAVSTVKNTSYSVEWDVQTSGATSLMFQVVTKGDFSQGVLDSDPSASFEVRRLARPVITVQNGVLTWDALDGVSYALYDNNNYLGDYQTSRDLSDLMEGAHALSVAAKSDNPAVFDSERSQIWSVVRLKTPVLEKEDLTEGFENYAFVVRLTREDTGAERYEITSSAYGVEYIPARTVGGYGFVPERETPLSVGKYTVCAKALGDGSKYLDSASSNQLTYYKLNAPAPQVNYAHERVEWTAVDVTDEAAVDAYVGVFNGVPFALADKSAEEFLCKKVSEKAGAGENAFAVKAVSRGNLSSNEARITVLKLHDPVVSVTATSLVCDREVLEESIQYTLNGSNAVTSASPWLFDELPLQDGENEFTFQRFAQGRLPSDVVEFTLEKLQGPKELVAQGAALSWKEVTGATQYRISVDGERYLSAQTAWSAEIADLAAGNYEVFVQAVAVDKAPSSAASVFVTRLAAPTELYLDEDTVRWTPVLGADSYEVSYGLYSQTLSETSLTLSYSYLLPGENIFTLRAVQEEAIASRETSLSVWVTPEPQVKGVEMDVIRWSNIPAVTEYRLTLDGNPFTATDNFFEVDAQSLSVGAHTFTVCAVRENELPSHIVNLSLTRLSAPSLTIEEGMVKWDSVAGATAYVVLVDGEEAERTENTYYTPDQSAEITVYALNGLSGERASIQFDLE